MEIILICLLVLCVGIFVGSLLPEETPDFFWLIIFALMFISFGCLMGIKIANAQEVNMTASVRWNNTNIHTTRHPQVSSFYTTEDGYIAEMADNTRIIYEWLIEGSLLRGDWQDARFHICNGNFYYAEELRGLSICLSKI